MLYLRIDLHRAQMTVSLRNENGDVILRRQVSTRWAKLEEFRGQLQQAGAAGEKFIAIVEVCGFHDWLVKWLQQDDGCHKVLVIQPLGRSATKTDRRDANALSELLWVNRERLLREDRVQGVRTVLVPGVEEQADRHLTQLRERLVRRRTQTINQIHKILRRHNLKWERPTKSFQTRKVAEWLQTLQLGPLDRLTLNQLLVQWKLWEEQLAVTDSEIGQRFQANQAAQLLATIPGVSMYIALAITCRNPAHRAVSPWAVPGKLPRSHARLPQFRRNGAFGFDHQGGQSYGPLPAGPGGPAAVPSSPTRGTSISAASSATCWAPKCGRACYQTTSSSSAAWLTSSATTTPHGTSGLRRVGGSENSPG